MQIFVVILVLSNLGCMFLENIYKKRYIAFFCVEIVMICTAIVLECILLIENILQGKAYYLNMYISFMIVFAIILTVVKFNFRVKKEIIDKSKNIIEKD